MLQEIKTQVHLRAVLNEEFLLETLTKDFEGDKPGEVLRQAGGA